MSCALLLWRAGGAAADSPATVFNWYAADPTARGAARDDRRRPDADNVRRLDFTGRMPSQLMGPAMKAAPGASRPIANVSANVPMLPVLMAFALVVLSMAGDLVFFVLRWRMQHRLPIDEPQRGARQMPVDFENACRECFDKAAACWHHAESAVLQIKSASPLRNLLMNELGQVAERLSIRLDPEPGDTTALEHANRNAYWRSLYTRLRRALGDVERIHATASAALATAGSALSDQPIMPRTRQEALHVLGANGDVDDQSLKRLVKALRQCWHPDLAQDEAHRTYRDLKLAQINVANDILTGRRAES